MAQNLLRFCCKVLFVVIGQVLYRLQVSHHCGGRTEFDHGTLPEWLRRGGQGRVALHQGLNLVAVEMQVTEDI